MHRLDNGENVKFICQNYLTPYQPGFGFRLHPNKFAYDAVMEHRAKSEGLRAEM